MRKLLESDSPVQVNLIASYLESNGVTVRIINEHQGDTRSVASYHAPVNPELWVSSAQFTLAARLVGRYQHEQRTADVDQAEWLCGKCRESNPDNFGLCWSCGQAR